jgi:hypothetical protein
MKRLFAPVLLYCAVTVVMMFPLLRHIGSVFPHDLGDPVLNTWLLWWSTKHVPLTTAWWNAPMFYPAPDAMAFSELLLGIVPLTAAVQWLTNNPVTAYNVAFLLSFPFCGWAAYLLAVELTGRRDAALLCGLAFAFAPYRMGQFGHLQVMSYYWAPVVLLGLHRYLRTRDVRWLGVFGGAWLLQSLTNGYALFHVSLFVLLWLIWFGRDARVVARILAAWAIAAIPVIPMLWKYRQVHTALHLVRDINEIKQYSVGLAGLLSPPPELALWGRRLWDSQGETAIFPGATMLLIGVASFVSWRVWQYGSHEKRNRDEQLLIVLSAVAAAAGLSVYIIGPWAIGPLTVSELRKPFSLAVLFRGLAFLRGRWMRRAWHEQSIIAFYLIALAAMYLLSLGPEPRFQGRPILYEAPYAWLLHVPGFENLRVPARFATLLVLCECVLLAFAMARWLPRLARPHMAAALIAIGLIADGYVRVRVEPVPASGPQWPVEVAAVAELPTTTLNNDLGPIYRSMFHGRPIINGYSGYYPPHYLPLVFSIRDRQFSGLPEVARGQLIGIAVNRSSGDAATAEAILSRMSGVSRLASDDHWSTYVMQSPVPPDDRPGGRLPITGISANRYNEDVSRMTDGRVETAWASGRSQVGDEEVLVDLGSEQSIGGIVLGMGAFSFGFPRDLVIDVSSDQLAWRPAWAGQTAVKTVHAALTNPGVVPLTIDVGQIKGRYLRMHQVGSEDGIPWWIAELSVRAPADTRHP